MISTTMVITVADLGIAGMLGHFFCFSFCFVLLFVCLFIVGCFFVVVVVLFCF